MFKKVPSAAGQGDQSRDCAEIQAGSECLCIPGAVATFRARGEMET